MNLLIRKILISNLLYILIIIGTIIICYFSLTKPELIFKEQEQYSGVVTEYLFNGNQLNLVIKGKYSNYKATYYPKTELELKKIKNLIKYGSHIIVTGDLAKPLNNTIPNTFNYKNYLKSKKILSIIQIKTIKINNDKLSILYKIKNYIIDRINTYKTKDYLLTFIIGNKTLLNNESLTNYRINGVTHLFAISGMHISLFTGIILFLLKKIKIKEASRLVIVTSFLIIYSFLTGFSPSILRAAIFFTLLSINKLFYTEITNIKLLITTVCILLISNPFNIYNLGFIYSVTTSYGLIICLEKFNNKNYIVNLILVSLVAFLFSLPITLQNFYEFNLLTIINNLIFVPLISLIVYPLSLLVFIFKFLEPGLMIVLYLTESLSKLTAKLAISLIIPKSNYILIFLYYLFLHLSLINKKYIFISIIIIFIPLILVKFNSDYEVYFLDVNQGDAILIKAPNNKENIMIDVGGKLKYKEEAWQIKRQEYNISDNIIIFLKSLGITKIDCIIGTHGDEDHLGEAINIINNFSVASLMLNQGGINRLEKNIIKTGINIINKYEAKYINIKYLETTLANNENDNSTIIHLNLNGYLFLLMGDASKKQELEIISKYNLENIHVLKLGHHGSSSSSAEEFLKIIKPQYSIISSGRNNRFNHPAQKVINLLNKYDLKYLNTQNLGTIKFTINDYLISSFTRP